MTWQGMISMNARGSDMTLTGRYSRLVMQSICRSMMNGGHGTARNKHAHTHVVTHTHTPCHQFSPPQCCAPVAINTSWCYWWPPPASGLHNPPHGPVSHPPRAISTPDHPPAPQQPGSTWQYRQQPSVSGKLFKRTAEKYVDHLQVVLQA
jgi:hypothetical protein